MQFQHHQQQLAAALVAHQAIITQYYSLSN
jgi:hypothetical protein